MGSLMASAITKACRQSGQRIRSRVKILRHIGRGTAGSPHRFLGRAHDWPGGRCRTGDGKAASVAAVHSTDFRNFIAVGSMPVASTPQKQ